MAPKSGFGIPQYFQALSMFYRKRVMRSNLESTHHLNPFYIIDYSLLFSGIRRQSLRVEASFSDNNGFAGKRTKGLKKTSIAALIPTIAFTPKSG